MNSSVNPIVTGLPLISADSSGALPPLKLPLEVLEQVSIGEKALLQIMQQENGTWQGVLKTSSQTFMIPINKNALPPQFGKAEDIEVIIDEKGTLLPVKEERIPAKDIAPKPFESFLQKIEPTPIKTADFVRQTLQKNGVPLQTAQKIADEIKSIQTQIDSFGAQSVPDNQAVLKPIMQTLQEIAFSPEKASELQGKLKQDVENLIGQKLTGEVASRSNDVTAIQTPLGKTLFDSKIKLPVAEKVVLNMIKTVSEETPFKVLDELLNRIVPQKRMMLSFQNETVKGQLKFLTEAEGQFSQEVVSVILNKLPVLGNNLFQNMVNFYQAAQQKNVEKWLASGNTEAKMAEILQDKNRAEEIKNFLSSSIKETPVWKIVEMPFFDGNWFAPLKIAVKKQPQRNKSNNESDKRVRFIVETSFSKLGNFQFDGFADKIKRKLDLIIRTSNNQSDDFCSNIINLFKKSLYVLDYTGNVKINKKEAFMTFQEQTGSEGIYV